jgi:hypothetical protein
MSGDQVHDIFEKFLERLVKKKGSADLVQDKQKTILVAPPDRTTPRL